MDHYQRSRFRAVSNPPHRQHAISSPRFGIQKCPRGNPRHEGRPQPLDRSGEDSIKFPEIMELVESFLTRLNIHLVYGYPYAYHNAIELERIGYFYGTGKELMVEIDQGFQPGGKLFNRLDGSTPFRQPGMEKTIRGRSWAIHDGDHGQTLDLPHDDQNDWKERKGLYLPGCNLPPSQMILRSTQTSC